MEIKVQKVNIEEVLYVEKEMKIGEMYVVVKQEGDSGYYWKDTLVIRGMREVIFLSNTGKGPTHQPMSDWDTSPFKYRKLYPGEQVLISGDYD